MKAMKMTLMLMIILALAQFASAALVTTGSNLDASLLYYEPVPARPGDSIDVWIQVSNDGGTASKGGTITILDSYPFTVENTEDRVKSFTSIPAQESFLVKAKVRIDKGASEGTNTLAVRVQQKESTNWIDRDLDITIQGRSSALSVSSVKTEPEIISPGSNAKVIIQLENIGDTLLRNLDVKLDLDGLSLAPSGGSDSLTLNNEQGATRGGKSSTIELGVTAFPEAKAGVYQVPLILEYEDEQGNTKTQNKTIGIVIGEQPDLLVYFDRIGITPESLRGDVVIKFVNKGLAEIKLLEMEVLENDDVHVVSESPVLYVGNIDEDDYESAELTLKVSGPDVQVPLRISYKDALNRDYQTTENLQLNLQKTNGSTGGSSWVWIILLIVIVAASIWFWRRKKAKKRRK